jgi:protein-L-isoaspartate(D-aspartate) O-methyltransferase
VFGQSPTLRERVSEAVRRVPREEFVLPENRNEAWADHALAIGFGQTISQPSLVAYMTEALALQPGDRVLEIGTGSGYQAAILAELGVEVYSIEILEPLARRAAATLDRLGYRGIHLRVGDGYQGWPEAAPFDGIIVACAPDHIPPTLVEQLREGGRLVIPVGPDGDQDLHVMQRRLGQIEPHAVMAVRFVPMTGVAERTPGAPT